MNTQDSMQQIGVAQKAIVLNKEGKFLTLFRTETAPARPNTWDLPGGDVDYGEDAIGGIVREIKEEAGLEVTDVKPFDVESHINKEENMFWVTIAYKCTAITENVVLSYEHNAYKWVTAQEFLELESAPKLRRFVENLK